MAAPHGVMLARIQQVITLSLVSAAALWAWCFVELGYTAWAWAGAFSILLGYSFFLAVEFLLMAGLHGDDPAPRATVAELLRAWWGEVRTAPRVFCWRQPFRSHAQPDHLPHVADGRRGVVLVHGFFCNRALWNPWMARLRARGIPFVAVNLEPVFGSIDAYASIIDASVRRLESLTGEAPVIVAHSMGGLAVRQWLSASADLRRIRRVITIGTPHRGTWLARFGQTPNGRQMRPGNLWLQELLARESGRSLNMHFTCFYSHCDNIVFPASTATLPGADNRHVRATAHVNLAFHPDVFDEACRWLNPERCA